MINTKLASLDAIEVDFSGKALPAKGAVVLLHGFGADNSDLASLSEVVDTADDIRWCFPNAPHLVEIGPHMTGRAWFPLRLADLERSGVDFTQMTPDGMDAAIDKTLKAVDAFRVKHKLQWNQIVLGGFSQGAMIALDVALKAPEPLAGVTLFSGSLVNEPRLRELATKRKGLKFFQSHGEGDAMLPFSLAEKLDRVLNESGMDGMLYSFRGGHEIPLPVLREWSSWLKQIAFVR
jgi:phospholipase/carboxylesterase